MTAVNAGGREYFAAWAHGPAGRDEPHDGKEVVQAEVYAAGTSGNSVVPLRCIDVPAEAVVRDGGASRTLVSWADGRDAAIDVTSGKVTTYAGEAGSVVGVSGWGVVANVSGGGFGGFGTSGATGASGGWSSAGVTPEGAAAEQSTGFGADLVNGTAQTVVDGKVLFDLHKGSVRDDGTAYGTAPGSDPRVAVGIPVSGRVES